MRIMYFVVLPFVEGRRGLLQEEGFAPGSRASALALGKRLAAKKAGVIVLSRSGDPELGDYDEANVLAVYGRVPAYIE